MQHAESRQTRRAFDCRRFTAPFHPLAAAPDNFQIAVVNGKPAFGA
jgi:hypothetical protein